MSRSLLIGSKPNANVAASTTVYWALANTFYGEAATATTEAPAQVPFTVTGRITNLYLRVGSNAHAASTYKLRKNGADGNNQISIGSSATGEFEDTSSTDTIASGDLVCVQLITGAGGVAFGTQVQNAIFNPDISSQTITKLSSADMTSVSYGTANHTSFIGPSSSLLNNASETNVGYPLRTSGTLKNMYCYVTANTAAAAGTVHSRKNGANGNLSISVGAASTGLFQDTTNSDSVAVGDVINYSFVTGAGATSFTFTMFGMSLITVNGKQQVCATGSTNINNGVDDFFGLYSFNKITTEAGIEAKVGWPFFATNLFATLSANTITAGTTVVVMRLGGADATLTLSIPAATTGDFEDTTHLDKLAKTSEIDIHYTAGATGTTTTLQRLGFLLQPVQDGGSFFGAGI